MKLVTLCSIVVVSTLVGVEGQFPKACINRRDLSTKSCCPVPSGFKEPCGSEEGRGECKVLHAEKWSIIYDHYHEDHLQDDRRNWPRLFFNRTCHCKSPFDGPDCGKCGFGYHGENCKKRVTLLRRRNLMKLTAEEQQQYMKYVNLSRHTFSDYVVTTAFYEDIEDAVAKGEDPLTKFANVSFYDLFIWQHYYAARNTYLNDSTIKKDIDFAHEGQGFLTWHRLFLLAWERVLQEITADEDFALPYWDWTDNELDELCTKELLGKIDPHSSTVEGDYFKDWYTICSEDIVANLEKDRKRLCDPANDREENLQRKPYDVPLPKKEDVDFVLRFEKHDHPPYSKYSSCSFRNLLEGYISTTTAFFSPKAHTLHNQVHIHIGGTMLEVSTAPSDPIFWLHHSFVDRLYEKWLRKYKMDSSVLSEKEAPIGHNRKDTIVPFFPIRTNEEMFKDSRELGYDYEDVGENGRNANTTPTPRM